MTTRADLSADNRRGYTFVELSITLLVCSILAAVAVPRYVGSLHQFRVDAAAKRIAADIAFVQRQAIVQSKSHSIQFTPNGGSPGVPNTYAMPTVNYVEFAAPGETVDVAQEPYKAVINSASFGAGATLTFDRYGAPSSGGAVVVAAGAYTKTVNVNVDTGRASIP